MKIPNLKAGSLYFHVPFCTKKCPYCHFYVVPNRPSYHALLLEGFQKELPPLDEVVSIYFGGGTPSLFIDSIACLPLPRCQEMTIEINPEFTDFEKLQPFNRVSIGVQSLDPALLECLGRLHTQEEAKRAVRGVKEAGIDNISIDLMMELPGQTLDSWKRTLDEALELPISHVSLYNLTFEPHTPFYRNRKELAKTVPNPSLAREMIEVAIDRFEARNLPRYEISAFGRPSVHNSGYWTGRPFLGIGPSAFSYIDGTRFQNVSNLHRYIQALRSGKSPIGFSETLSEEKSKRERLAIALRLVRGVPLEEVPSYPEIDPLIQRGWLEKKEGRLALSLEGTFFYDSVATELI